MADPNPDSAPLEAERKALERLVRGIVLSQGNVFIKELLREKSLPIGATKAEFERNLTQAIADGKLTRADFEEWLDRVEGWGDQHVYLFNLSDTLAKCEELSSVAALRAKVKGAGLEGLWQASTSSEFPEKPKLTSISFDGSHLQLTWHEGSLSWVRDKRKVLSTLGN